MRCKIEGCIIDACRYAHNQYELDYHPLVYKTEICQYESSNQFNCIKLSERCPKAHSLRDLRDIHEIFKKLKANAEAPIINDTIYTSVLEKPKLTEFSLDTYKTIECPDKDGCNTKYCLYYHNEFEQRRNPTKYPYYKDSCSNIYSNGRFDNPKNCEIGRASCRERVYGLV